MPRSTGQACQAEQFGRTATWSSNVSPAAVCGKRSHGGDAGWRSRVGKPAHAPKRGAAGSPRTNFAACIWQHLTPASCCRRSGACAAASWAQMPNRLDDDWQVLRGCCWPRPARSISRVPKAGNRIHVGKGYSNGQHTEPRGAPKQLHVRFGATRSARAGKLPAERAEAASGKSPVNSVRLSLRKTFPALKGANIPRHVSSASMCLPGWPGTGGGYARSPPRMNAPGTRKSKKTELVVSSYPPRLPDSRRCLSATRHRARVRPTASAPANRTGPYRNLGRARHRPRRHQL